MLKRVRGAVGYKSKAMDEYETFKENYITGPFTSGFKKLYDTAISDIKKQSKTEPSKFDYKSQDALVEYYVMAKLVDAERQTEVLFNKLNDFIGMKTDSVDYGKIKNMNFDELIKEYDKPYDIGGKNTAMSNVIRESLKKEQALYGNEYLQRLLLLLFIIRYYPVTILATIFNNGKNTIESIIKNTSTINNNEKTYTTRIQQIVDEIDPEPNTDAEAVVQTVKNAADAAAASQAGLETLREQATKTVGAILEAAKRELAAALVRRDNAIARVDEALSVNDKAVAQAELEAAKAELEAAKAELEAAKAALEEAQARHVAAQANLEKERALAAGNAADAGPDAVVAGPDAAAASAVSATPANTGFLEWFGFKGASQNGASQNGGARTSVTDTLQTINNAADEDNTEISKLVKYSTNIFYKALTILSLSIGFPSVNDEGLIKLLEFNINQYFNDEILKKVDIDTLEELKTAISNLITYKNNSNIISTITKIDSIIKLGSVVPAVVIPTKSSELSAISIARSILFEKLQVKSVDDSKSVQQLLDEYIHKYTHPSRGIDKEQSIAIATAIANVYNRNINAYSLKDILAAARIAAANAYQDKDYNVEVNNLLETKKKLPGAKVRVGGALASDYNFETNLQAIIKKGIESSKFFRPVDEPPLLTKGGQRTQKNRNRNRSSGGTRKNMSSIETSDY